MSATTATRRVFIALVAEPLNGAWHDLHDFADLDALTEAALAKIDRTPANNYGEELDCSDYEGFGDLFSGNHYTSVQDAWTAHERLTACEDAGLDADVALAYASNMGCSTLDADDIQEAYIGEFASFTALAEHFVDEGFLGEIPDALKNYIDCEAYGRDLSYGDVFEVNGYYFWNR